MGILSAPAPKVSHQFVAFVSLKDSSFTARDVIVAGVTAFGKNLVAADVFTASRQIAFAFPTAACADTAVTTGLRMTEETTLPLARRADYQPQLCFLESLFGHRDSELPTCV